jgi:hypothetical protein
VNGTKSTLSLHLRIQELANVDYSSLLVRRLAKTQGKSRNHTRLQYKAASLVKQKECYGRNDGETEMRSQQGLDRGGS